MTESILKPLFAELLNIQNRGRKIEEEVLKEQQLFEATEGHQEAGKFGKKPQRRDDK